jgi:hypothetical protein
MIKVKTFASPLKVFHVTEQLENLDTMINQFIAENNIGKIISVSDSFLPRLEAISKIHLTPNYGVADLLKMLTYSLCMLRFFVGPRLILECNLHF